jgi:hypothetical protein
VDFAPERIIKYGKGYRRMKLKKIRSINPFAEGINGEFEL